MIRCRHRVFRRPNVVAPITAICAAGLAGAIVFAAPAAPGQPAAGAAGATHAMHSTHSADASAATDEPWTVAPVDSLGGTVNDMAVDEQRQLVWAAQGPHVIAIDMHDPSAPKMVGRSAMLDEIVTALAVDGTTGVALIRSHSSQDPEVLVTLDLSDPTAPRAVASIALDRYGIGGQTVVADGMAFVGHVSINDPVEPVQSRRRLVAIDVHDLSAPRIVDDNMVPAPGDVYDIKRVGDVLAATAVEWPAPGQPGRPVFRLHLFDLAVPGHLRPAAMILDPSWYHLGTGPGADRGTTLYGYGKEGGVVALDIAQPDAPREIRRWPAAAEWDGDIYAATSIRPTLLIDEAGVPFLVTRETTGYYKVSAVDVTSEVGGQRSSYLIPTSPCAAAMSGRYVLVAEMSGDIGIVDTQALTPEASSAARVGSIRTLGIVTMLAMRRDRPDGLLYASGRRGGITVLDLERPYDPSVIGRYVDGASRDVLQVAGGIAASGRDGWRAGVPDPTLDRLDVIDLTDPRAPRRQATYTDGRFARIAVAPDATWIVHGRYFGAGDQPPLTFSPAAGPSGGSETALPLDVRLLDGATVGGRFLSVGTYPPSATACTSNRLALWDVPDASGPARRISHLDVSPCKGEAKNLRVAVAGDIAYVTQVLEAPSWPGIGRSQMFVVSVRDPLRPRVIAQLPISNTANELIEHGGYLFASVGWGGATNHANITIIDVRRPTAPRVVGSLPDLSGAVAVSDGHVYVSNGTAGVWVFEPPIDWSPLPPADARIALPWLGAGAMIGSP